MNEEEFREVLTKAQTGDNLAMETIIKSYMPLINKNSYWRDVLDEDLRQYILLHIIKNITKFKI